VWWGRLAGRGSCGLRLQRWRRVVGGEAVDGDREAERAAVSVERAQEGERAGEGGVERGEVVHGVRPAEEAVEESGRLRRISAIIL
jgi:hypothetical protein